MVITDNYVSPTLYYTVFVHRYLMISQIENLPNNYVRMLILQKKRIKSDLPHIYYIL